MIYELENSALKIEVDSFGAQLKSIKEKQTEREYLWSGDAAYWGKTSPVLFPFVGALKNGTYTYDGKEYPMGRHGFARDMEFQLKEKTENALVFLLSSTEETRKKYPFRFCFEAEYRLEGKNLRVIWRVLNQDEKTMYFSLGGHPAFACPPNGEGKRTDCFIKFDTEHELVVSDLDMSTGLLTGEKTNISLEQEYLPITEELFDRDALVIENHQSHEVALCDEKRQPYIKVCFDAPLFGVWSVPDRNASYVCIEPWYGRCDRADFTGELQDRDWTNVLEPKKVFEKEYVISIL